MLIFGQLKYYRIINALFQCFRINKKLEANSRNIFNSMINKSLLTIFDLFFSLGPKLLY